MSEGSGGGTYLPISRHLLHDYGGVGAYDHQALNGHQNVGGVFTESLLHGIGDLGGEISQRSSI